MRYIPYSYKLYISHNDERLTYIGCRIEEGANPRELRDGYVPNVKCVNDIIKKGGIVLGYTTLERFEGNEGGIKSAITFTNDLLKFLNAAKDPKYINGRNYITSHKQYEGEIKFVAREDFNNEYHPFILVAETPDGKVTKYKFDGKQPSKDCLDFGLSGTYQSRLKKHEVVTINRVNASTRHPFPRGTKLTIESLKK